MKLSVSCVSNHILIYCVLKVSIVLLEESREIIVHSLRHTCVRDDTTARHQASGVLYSIHFFSDLCVFSFHRYSGVLWADGVWESVIRKNTHTWTGRFVCVCVCVCVNLLKHKLNGCESKYVVCVDDFAVVFWADTTEWDIWRRGSKGWAESSPVSCSPLLHTQALREWGALHFDLCRHGTTAPHVIPSFSLHDNSSTVARAAAVCCHGNSHPSRLSPYFWSCL